MKAIFLTFCLASLLTGLAAQEQYMKSVVRITAQIEGIGEETGAGIIVGKEGQKYFVATARHVVDGSTDIAVQVHGDKAKYKASVLHQDEGMDAAVLVFTPGKALTLQELFPAEPGIITQGRKVQSIGHPGGGYWLANLLNLVQQSSLYEDERFFSITPQAVIGGCSGGPVFIETGAWLGMITETSAVQAKCLKAEALTKWLKTKKVPTRLVDFPVPEIVSIEGQKSRADSFFISQSDESTDYSKLDVSEVKTFSLGKYEVTLREFEAFVTATGYVTSAEREGQSNAIKERGKDHRVLEQMPKVNWRHDDFGRLRPQNEYNYPVLHVSWKDADAYCKWLSKKTGKNFRLPTEAEWVYAFLPSKNQPAKDKGIFGNIMDVTWNYKIGINMIPRSIRTYYADGFTRIAPAGSFSPNEWGIHDLYGNVSEWCSDAFKGWDDGDEIVKYSYSGPNWLCWYLDDKARIVERGYPDLFKAGETSGRSYAYYPIFDPDESNCFLGFRVASD